MLRTCALAAIVVIAVSPIARAADLRLANAAKRGDATAVASLIKQVDVNTRMPDGATALHWAVHRDDMAMVTLLIGAGANVNTVNEYGVGPLWVACTNANGAIVEALVAAGANVNLGLPTTGETPLMTCARTGNARAVKALVIHGADVQAAETHFGQTALMWAAAERHRDVMQVLLESGSDIHARSRQGYTPLLFAAREGEIASVRLLLASGADINESAPDGTNVLDVATVRGHVELAKLLLERGANPNKGEAGYMPLHWASGVWDSLTAHDYQVHQGEWSALGGIPTREGKRDIIKALLAHGADPNARIGKSVPRHGIGGLAEFQKGATPFLVAALSGDVETMKLLLDGGADPALVTASGNSALVLAAGISQDDTETISPESTYLDAVKFLVSLGADVNAHGGGYTAMHVAAKAGYGTIVQFLLDQGADLNIRGKDGQTPLDLAEGGPFESRAQPRPAIAALLLKHGAERGGAKPTEPKARPANRP